MNFKLIVLAIVLVLVPLAYADVRVDTIKGYVNDERAADVDEDGGDFEVLPDDTLELIVSVDNRENVSIKVRLEGTIENIDDGEDLKEEMDWYDISANDDRAKTLSFLIPSDAKEDNYDMSLLVRYKFTNGTEANIEREFGINVLKETELVEEVIDYDGILTNMSASCISIAKATDSCFGYIEKHNTCTAELSTIKEERGGLSQQVTDLGTKVSSCEADKSEIERQKTTAENQVKGMLTYAQCNATVTQAEERAKEDASKSNQNMILVIGLGAGAFWYIQNRKKNKTTVADSYYYDKT